MASPVIPSANIQARLRSEVAATSVRQAATRLDVAETTVVRILAGLPIQKATAEFVEQRIAVDQ